MLLVPLVKRKCLNDPFPPSFISLFTSGFSSSTSKFWNLSLMALAGTHRIFAPFLGGFYHVLMNIFEFLAVAVLLSCVIMLLRRNVLKLKRFWSAEMTAGPDWMPTLFLITEIVLMLAILTMNAADQIIARNVSRTLYAYWNTCFSAHSCSPCVCSHLAPSTLISH